MVWAHAVPTILASFLASMVEFVEALTVVLAVGVTRGWRSALGGAALGALVLAMLVVALGPAITQVPIRWLQIGLGALLLLFGMRWLRKAILRASGFIPLHDEAAAYAKQTAALGTRGVLSGGWDREAVSAAFKITMIEGIEVVFIVVAMGATGRGLLLPASLGALAALAVVIGLGLILHRPLAMVPENTLKFIVGVLLCAFGTFWVGEGFGFAWPGDDWSLVALVLGFLTTSLVAGSYCRRALARMAS